MRTFALLSALLMAALSSAQVVGLRVAVHSTCPEGVPGCWPGILQGLTEHTDLAITAEPDLTCWMVEARSKTEKLPSVTTISKAVHSVGAPFSIRGIEATIRGRVVSKDGQWLLQAPGYAEPIRLVAALKSFEWDLATKACRPLRPEEKAAFAAVPPLNKRWVEVRGWIKTDGVKTPELQVVAVGAK